MTAAADQHHGPVHAGDLLHLPDEVRVDVPVRAVVPGDVLRALRMADEQVFHLAAAVDEDGSWILLQELLCFGGLQVLHGGIVWTADRKR